MNKEIIKKVYFFKNKPPYFIAFVGPLLKPLRVEGNNYIYRQGDPVEEIYFLTKGKAAFVSEVTDGQPYLIIEAGYYFGEIDFVYPSYQQLVEPLLATPGKQISSTGTFKRYFPAKAIDGCDLLTLSKQDLFRVEAEYEFIVAEMFVHSHNKIRRILKIKEQAESSYFNRAEKEQPKTPRRMATSIYGVQHNAPAEPMNSLRPIDEEEEICDEDSLVTDDGMSPSKRMPKQAASDNQIRQMFSPGEKKVQPGMRPRLS